MTPVRTNQLPSHNYAVFARRRLRQAPDSLETSLPFDLARLQLPFPCPSQPLPQPDLLLFRSLVWHRLRPCLCPRRLELHPTHHLCATLLLLSPPIPRWVTRRAGACHLPCVRRLLSSPRAAPPRCLQRHTCSSTDLPRWDRTCGPVARLLAALIPQMKVLHLRSSRSRSPPSRRTKRQRASSSRSSWFDSSSTESHAITLIVTYALCILGIRDWS